MTLSLLRYWYVSSIYGLCVRFSNSSLSPKSNPFEVLDPRVNYSSIKEDAVDILQTRVEAA